MQVIRFDDMQVMVMQVLIEYVGYAGNDVWNYAGKCR